MKVLRLPEVIETTGLSRTSIYRKEGQDEFPKRRRLGPNAVGWLEEEVIDWVRSRPPAHQAPSSLAKLWPLRTRSPVMTEPGSRVRR